MVGQKNFHYSNGTRACVHWSLDRARGFTNEAVAAVQPMYSLTSPPLPVSDKTVSLACSGVSGGDPGGGNTIPYYLTAYYAWAYVHPRAVKLFERQWLVNLILWGNYVRLRDAALSELEESLSGNTLQVACVYGDLTNRLSGNVEKAGGSIDIVDVLPVQLGNLRDKLPKNAPVRLLTMDAAALELPDASYENCLIFFLLHEQPRQWREQTLREVLRVVKPGGKIVIVDYAKPHWWHPLRYLWRPLLATLEPFALDLWREQIADWLPRCAAVRSRKQLFFGGLYQKLVITRHGSCARDEVLPQPRAQNLRRLVKLVCPRHCWQSLATPVSL
jgi:ubiquinone/menaquinone biosynthesis C-methylase UbiE